jgi:hypothetical protein
LNKIDQKKSKQSPQRPPRARKTRNEPLGYVLIKDEQKFKQLLSESRFSKDSIEEVWKWYDPQKKADANL